MNQSDNDFCTTCMKRISKDYCMDDCHGHFVGVSLDDATQQNIQEIILADLMNLDQQNTTMGNQMIFGFND